MRPARIVVAVVLTAVVAATGSYLAYTGNHRSAAASPTTAAPAPSATTTTLPTRVTTSTSLGVSDAACSSQAILPLLKRKFDNPSGELVIVRADIKRCRNGYAHVFAISRPNPPGHPQYENEQLFLRDVNGSWQSVAEGTGIACSDADITAAMLRACRALDYPTHTTPPPTPRIPDPAMAARQLFDAWQAGNQRHALGAATPAAVHTLFAFKPSQANQLRFEGCHSSSPGYHCGYLSTNVGLYYLDMAVQGGASAGYRVVSIDAEMRFGSPDDAAKYLMHAWLANDRADARNAASNTVIDALWNQLRDRSNPPRFTGCTFQDGNHGADCTFNSTTVGLGLTMQVKGGALLGWHVEAVKFAQL
jgi:hypothetical protein